jgi:3-oxoacyl-[acyl-carrier protein] reductase
MLSFASGCVVITGGGGLLGRGLALCRPAPPIARRGASVVVTDVNGAAAQAVAAEAAAVPGARALAVTADVTDRASMDALAETASDAFGSVRVLRNNAGVTSFPLPSADWYRDNLLSPDQVAQETITGFMEDRLHIFPHRTGRQEVTDRHDLLLQGFEAAALTSPPLMSQPLTSPAPGGRS